MILSCPSCSARFVVDARALQPNGRVVKCGKCAHQWREEAPPPEPGLATDGGGVDELVPPPLEPPQSFRRRTNLPAYPPPPKRRRSGVVALALVASIVAVAAGILWFGRAPLMELWPPAAKLYAAIGIGETEEALPVLGEGLQLDQVTPRRTTEGNVPYLVIEGEVVNSSETTREVPRMVAVLSNVNDEVVQHWTFSVEARQLGPGERVPFSTRLADPSEAASGIKIEFTE